MRKKTLTLQSAEYKLLSEGFIEWLQLLGYSALGIPALTGAVKDFLHHQEATGKLSLQQLTATDANDFIRLLQTRTGQRTGKPLSPAHINKQVQALKLFSRYIRETGRSLVAFNLQRLEENKQKPAWLTQAEMERLYNAIPGTIIGIRDKAMLAVYYGCGLRLNEGACLEISDINQIAKVLHVRKGKRYKERFVPVADKNFEEIMLYINYARPQLLSVRRSPLKGELEGAFFVDANKGHPMHKQSLYVRIKQLVRKAKLQKKVGTHTLRHSIATHLLQSGMKLEMIQRFLGHADLDSTQIYTHLVNDEL